MEPYTGRDTVETETFTPNRNQILTVQPYISQKQKLQTNEC